MSMYDARTGITYAFSYDWWDDVPPDSATVVYPTSGCYYGDGYGKLLQQGMNLQNITVKTQFKYIPEEDDYDEYCDELYVLSGGTATNITVNEAAWLYVENGGTVVNLTLDDAWGGVSSGGKLTGKITFLDAEYYYQIGGYFFSNFSVADGATIDFDLTRTSPGASALVNCLAGFSSGSYDDEYLTYHGSYTLTVAGNQANGTYKLAEYASGFANTITVLDKNSGAYLGKLNVGETATINGKAYTMNLSGGSLTVTIGAAPVVDTTAPQISLISGSPTSSTTGSVTVTASFTDNVGVTATYYKLGENGSWRTYSNSVTVSENMTVYFKAVDKAGNESQVCSYVVSNIVMPKPAQPTASADITAMTNQTVTVTASFDSNTATKQYSLDGRNWSTYTSGITLTQNGTVYFRGLNSQGTASDVTSYTVSNIDKVAPVVSGISYSPSGPTNRSVTVTATFTDNVAVASVSYRIGTSGSWRTYYDGVTVSENTTVYFKAVDKVGNISEIASCAVSNITDRPIISSMLYVSSGSTALSPYVVSGGILDILSGGGVNNASVETGGLLYVLEGGTANGTTVDPGGWLIVSSGGTADGVAVNAGGVAYAVDGGAIRDAAFGFGAWLVFSGGGKLTGRLTFESGANISASSGAVLDFDLTRTYAGDAALVNDLSVIQGVPLYTLTVDGNLSGGTYKLADGASGFDKTISVVNTSGTALGTLAVGQTATLGGVDYTLNLNGGSLTVSVSGGSFAPGPVLTPGKLPSFTGDFIGNGRALLAVKDEDLVRIYWRNGTVLSELALDEGWAVAGVGDIDGDGADDILRVHSSGLVVGEMSDGYGEFSPQVLNSRSDGWSILGTGDFNHNGTDDVLIANPTGASDTVGLLGYWESGVTWTLINGYSAEWECVATGDFSGDGKCDMLWRNSFVGDGGGTYNAYCTWIVDPPAGQSDWRIVSVANPSEWDFLCAGDFDGNGSHDIAMINGEGVVGIWGVADGYLSSWSILSAVDTSTWSLAGVGDFNGDGTDDIAWSNTDTGLTGYWQIDDKTLTTWANIATIT